MERLTLWKNYNLSCQKLTVILVQLISTLNTLVTKAIANMGKMIDEKAKNYQNNPCIMEMVEGIKSNYKQQILDKASEILNNGAE